MREEQNSTLKLEYHRNRQNITQKLHVDNMLCNHTSTIALYQS